MKGEKSKTCRLLANLQDWRRCGYQPPSAPKLAKAIHGELLFGGKHDERVLLEIVDCFVICREALPRAFAPGDLHFFLKYAKLPYEEEIEAIKKRWHVGERRAFTIRKEVLGEWELRLWREMAAGGGRRGGRLRYYNWARLCNGYLYPEARPDRDAAAAAELFHAV